MEEGSTSIQEFTSLINDEYRITRKLGGGSFGEIHLALGQSGQKVAVKFEKVTARCPQLRHEYKVYRELANCAGFGRVHYYGVYEAAHNVMVMDLLGPSLEDLFTKCGRRFSLKTVLQLADQLLERMEAMHNRHLIHRDVKPANFVMGPSAGSQTVYSIDFGLSTRYRHPRTLQHIPFREGRSLTGTPRYASINNHLGLEQSRRDDLESVGYVLIYFLKGSLPWQGLKARSAKRKYKLILERKQAVSIQQLCHNLPQQFAEYLAYCRSLKFEAKPNISYLRGLFRELYKGAGYGPSAAGVLEWDWTKYEHGNGSTADSGAGECGGGAADAQPQELSVAAAAALMGHTSAAAAADTG
ncbi:kinase-like domain-containing protein, partial [Tribonema minus]